MRFITASVCILFASALAGAKAQLEKLVKTIGFCGGICVCAICARSATILQTERKSNKITVKSHTKSTLPRKLKTTSKKCRFEHQNASRNRPRRPGRAPGPPPARDFRQKNFHFWLLPGSKSASKSKLEFDVIFERFGSLLGGGAGGRRAEPGGGDLGEFTFGKRWGFSSNLFRCSFNPCGHGPC